MLKTIEKESFYAPEDLAEKFKISLSSIYKLIRSGEIGLAEQFVETLLGLSD